MNLTIAHPKCTDDVFKEKLQALITDAQHILILRHETDEFPDLEFNEKWEKQLSLADLS